MGRSRNRSTLSQTIASILGATRHTGNPAMRPRTFYRLLIRASLAMLAITPILVNAVSLGEISVNSRFGQPLDASVPLTLAAGESMPKDCVVPARGRNGISTPGQLQVSSPAALQSGTYNLRVTTPNALHEPMYEISLLIDCPGTPLLLRTYMLILDLPGALASAPKTEQTNISGDTLTVPTTIRQTPSQPVDQATAQKSTQRVERSESVIHAGQPYRVGSGDTLSTIAARVAERSPDTTWSVANHIYLSNPQAFISNNPNLIKLGSLIKIPSVTELSGIKKGHTSKTVAKSLTVTAKSIAAQPEPLKNPQLPTAPVPIPAPVTTQIAPQVTRKPPKISVVEPTPKQSDTLPLNTGQNAVITETNLPAPEQPAPAFPTLSAGTGDTSDTAIITPFLDEQPVSARDSSATDPATSQIPVVAATARSEPAKPVNPMVAVFVGILLGAIISMLTLRRPLIEAFAMPFRRRRTRMATRSASTDTVSSTAIKEDTTAGTNTFDTAIADEAFDAQQEFIEPIPVTDPSECTYIVEASGPDTIENFATMQVGSEDEMLNRLFADDASKAEDSGSDIFDPTGSFETAATGTFTEQTAQIPLQSEAEELDPTAEFNSEIFNQDNEIPAEQPDFLPEKTADMPMGGNELQDSTLINSLNDTIDSNEMFATSDSLVDDFLDESPTNEMPFEATIETQLTALPSDNDDDDMSATLQEAMLLLENEYEDEFTASQILEREDINRAIESAEADHSEENDPPKEGTND